MEDGDSDEGGAGHLLTAWLGELDTLKKVKSPPHLRNPSNLPFQGLDVPSGNGQNTVLRRSGQQHRKQEYRCSLINIEDSQDHELDAILGELSELETQFSKEITIEERKRSSDESSRDYSIISRLPSGSSREGGTGAGRNCRHVIKHLFSNCFKQEKG